MLKQPIKVYPVNYEDGLKRGLKQGYAKALADVEKEIDKWLHVITVTEEGRHVDLILKELKQSIAKEKK